jgi:act minimal PKS chain-length factor (CLF/KS beta)
MNASVVVSGMGVVAPNGLGAQDYWSAVRIGKSGIGRLSRFDPAQYPSRLAGEIHGFEAGEHLPNRLLPQTDRMTRLALVASDWALADAGVVPKDMNSFEMGVVTSSSSGGFEFGQNELQRLWSQGSEYVSAYQSFAWFYAVNSGQISIRHGMRGPSGVVVSDQSGGLDAVAQARRQIRKGTPLVVSGSVDATLCPWGWVGLMTSGRLSTGEDPATAYVPFDSRAAGHVPGEGGAILIVEREDRCRERGAQIYGQIAGYGSTFDPRPGSGRPPGLRKAIELALADAGATPDEVDVVFADGAALPELDRIEAEALTAVFGRHAVPVTVPKTMTGSLYSAAAALDLATVFLTMAEGLIPPTVHTDPVEEYGLDLVVGQPRTAQVRTALVVARGHQGFNSAMVVRSADSLT